MRIYTARPLVGWPGAMSTARRMSPFRASFEKTLAELERELKAVQARNVVLQMAIGESDIRLDGAPRATARPSHPGVILSFDSMHGSLSYPCDTYLHWEDNLRAITLALMALRAVDRYGVTHTGEQYKGWRAIGGRVATLSPEAAAQVVLSTARIEGPLPRPDDLQFKSILNRAKRNAHPDTGGDEETWRLLMQAEKVLTGRKA